MDESLEEICKKQIAIFSKDLAFDRSQQVKDFVGFKERCMEMEFSKSHTDYPFITINTKPGTTYPELWQAVQDILPMFHWAYYSFEVGQNNNLHCHLVGHNIKWDTNWSRKIKAPFQQMCLTTNKRCFCVKWPVTDEDLKQLKSYIEKSFVSKSKQKADDATKKFREEESIEPYSIYGDIPTCLSPTLPLITNN